MLSGSVTVATVVSTTNRFPHRTQKSSVTFISNALHFLSSPCSVILNHSAPFLPSMSQQMEPRGHTHTDSDLITTSPGDRAGEFNSLPGSFVCVSIWWGIMRSCLTAAVLFSTSSSPALHNTLCGISRSQIKSRRLRNRFLNYWNIHEPDKLHT